MSIINSRDYSDILRMICDSNMTLSNSGIEIHKVEIRGLYMFIIPADAAGNSSTVFETRNTVSCKKFGADGR